VPCRGDTPALHGADLERRRGQLGAAWAVVEEHHLEKTYRFRNFSEALAFTQRIGNLAEALAHHPDVHLSWGRVRVVIWTHKAGGLTESDFILAARADQLAQAEATAHDSDGRRSAGGQSVVLGSSAKEPS
jgi:4a-hydroxytetrahydrobiopterin dehydratase